MKNVVNIITMAKKSLNCAMHLLDASFGGSATKRNIWEY